MGHFAVLDTGTEAFFESTFLLDSYITLVGRYWQT